MFKKKKKTVWDELGEKIKSYPMDGIITYLCLTNSKRIISININRLKIHIIRWDNDYTVEITVDDFKDEDITKMLGFSQFTVKRIYNKLFKQFERNKERELQKIHEERMQRLEDKLFG